MIDPGLDVTGNFSKITHEGQWKYGPITVTTAAVGAAR